jgi:WD40 repeat protein
MLLALGGYDSKVRIWQITPGSNLNNDTKPDVLLSTGGNDLFSTLAFSRDGNWLAAGTTSGDVYFWGMSDGRRIYTLEVLSDPIKKIVFSQDGAHIVIATLNETWILTIGDRVLTKENVLAPGTTDIYAIDVSPAGDLQASAGGDSTVWIQSLPDGKILGRLKANKISISNLAFSEDGTILLTRLSNGMVNLWQVRPSESQPADIKLMNTFQTRGYTGTVTFSPNNKYLISTGMVGEITLWSVPDGNLYTISNSVPNEMVYSLAFSKRGDKLAAVFENKIVLWSVPASLSTCHRTHSFPGSYPNPD